MQKTRERVIAALAGLISVLILFAVLSFAGVFSASAAENESFRIEKLDGDSELFKNGYLDRYGVPTSKFEYKNNGGAEQGAPLDYAFDRNFGSIWRSQMQFNGTNATINNVEATFKEPVLIDRILYQADSSWGNRGSFTKVRISYIPENGNDYISFAELDYPQTSETNANLITFKQSYTVKAVKIEWLGVHNGHRTCAAASEIIFLQPYSEAVEAVQNMFTDYAQLELSDSIQKKEDVEALRDAVKGYSTYDTELSGMLTRAEQILEKKIIRDPRREMGTAENSTNLLTRLGDVAGYARNPLKMAWFGTNRQVTGVCVTPEDTLTVYVEAEDGDPLPRLVVTQFWGAWSGWKSGEYTLNVGKNVIHPQNYNKEGYVTQHQSNSARAGIQVPTGGTVYLVNPYEKEDQSDKVKVYIEGGTLIPVFRRGGDVEYYKEQVKMYAETVEADWERFEDPYSSFGEGYESVLKVVDVTEIVSENIIITVRASRADEAFNVLGYDPQKTTENWDSYVKQLLESDGVILDEKDDGKYGGKYDPHARYLNCNIRLMQPFGAAYAYTEHVGIQVDWEMGALTGENFGWGYTHELGHMMDMSERVVSECSNNMLSKYEETVMSRIAQRGDFDKTTAALAPDERDVASFWNTNRGNFIFWWLIESFHNGYWPTLENLYRYENLYEKFSKEELAELGTVNATEKQIYLSSLAVQYDLSYYFERWGYNLSTNDPVFTRATASKMFRRLMDDAKKDGRIKQEGYEPKIWYVDADEWWARANDKEVKTSIYTAQDHPTLKAVTPSDEGYALLIDGGTKSKLSSHLGFEILEGSGANAKVVGFSYSETFIDTTAYPSGYVPVYSVIAYDRGLTFSSRSEERSAQEQEAVCKIGDRGYMSVRDAVAAANAWETITLIKDCYASSIVIDKKVTISGTGRILSKNGPGELFRVVDGGDLTLKGAEGAPFVLDGSGIEQASSLIRVSGNGRLTLNYCTLRNSHILYKSQNNGGALSLVGDSASIVSVSDTTFENNSARLGGAVYLASGHAPTFTRCEFKGNSAQEGGAVYSRNATIRFESSTFTENQSTIWGGAIAGYAGSVVYLEHCDFTENASERGGALYLDGTANITGGKLENNSATEEGGAIYYSRTTSGGRELTVTGNTVIGGNKCQSGAALYCAGVVRLTAADISAGDCLYALTVPNGSVAFSGGKLAGDIFKSGKSEFTVTDSLFEAVGGIAIVIDAETIDVGAETDSVQSVLFTANFTFEAEAATPFKTDRGTVVASENTLVAALDTVTITFTAGDHTWSGSYLPGKELVLGTDSGDEKTYVTRWTKDGEVFEVGSSYLVSDDAQFTGEVANKTRIDFHYPQEVERSDAVRYVIPGESYVLPRDDFKKYEEQYVLGGWNDGNTHYLPGSTCKAGESDVVYTAEITEKFAVRYWLQADGLQDYLLTTLYYAYGETVLIAGQKYDTQGRFGEYVTEGKHIEGYFMKGTSELLDVNYTAVSDLDLVADIEEEPIYVNYTISYGDSLTNDFDKVKYGSDYALSLRSVPYGYHPVKMRLDIAGDDDYPDPIEFQSLEEMEGFVIEDIKAMYCLVVIDVEKNDYTVTYLHNGEETGEQQRVKYNDTIRIAAPTEEELPEKHHFMSIQVGREELVFNDEGEFVEMLQFIDMQLDENGEASYVVTDDIVVNILTYTEVEAEPQEESGSDAGQTPEENETGGLSAAAIAGIAVGAVAFVAAAVIVFVVVKKRKH